MSTDATKAWRWLPILSAIVFGVAVLIGIGIVAAWQYLPEATITIDGESVSLPALQGWSAAVGLVIGVATVLLTAVLVVGAVAIALIVAVLCVALVVFALAFCLLMVFSPVLLLGWLLWRLSRTTPVAARMAS